ncbi:hypothetical protein PRUB_a0682 [Pseudoalteromonas rubra]|uniref:Uncharacterized protein n=1 Tax=Pseudoalteromonas rubra TaxID=43658 RepID=A0A8T0C6E6_9GAMM|nr:hypothetical protein PRUB_a0682 [Pseudoalteromonas rubra]
MIDPIYFAKNQIDNNTMRDTTTLHDMLRKNCPHIHARRLDSFCSLAINFHSLSWVEI